MALTGVRVDGFVQRGSICMQGGLGGGCHHRRLIAFCRPRVGVVRMDCRCKARTLEAAGSTPGGEMQTRPASARGSHCHCQRASSLQSGGRMN